MRNRELKINLIIGASLIGFCLIVGILFSDRLFSSPYKKVKNTSDIIGYWEYEDYGYSFNKDGTGTSFIAGTPIESFKYHVKDGILYSVNSEGQTTDNKEVFFS